MLKGSPWYPARWARASVGSPCVRFWPSACFLMRGIGDSSSMSYVRYDIEVSYNYIGEGLKNTNPKFT